MSGGGQNAIFHSRAYREAKALLLSQQRKKIRKHTRITTTKSTEAHIFSTAIREALEPKGVSKQKRQEGLIIAAGEGDVSSMTRLLEDYGLDPN